LTSRPNQRSHTMASLGEHSGYMPADKAGCSRY
jgi:hypothetical protein